MGGPAPAPNGHGLLARRVAERVAERDEVQAVVGVHVPDDHRLDIDVVAYRRSLENTPLPQSSSSPNPSS